jgi:RNA polymerase-binding transcription factor DksA
MTSYMLAFRVDDMTELAEFERLLLLSKSELERRLAAINLDVRNETNPVSSDSGEQTTERQNDQVIDALGNSARAELALINKALSRIDSGEYFECEECGEPISKERLGSIPYASLCVKCAEKQEDLKVGG